MWKKAKIQNPIWYFDATGSINKDVEGQKKPFFYSMAFHDSLHTSIIPFAEFVTTANDQNTISKYLSSIKVKLEEHSKENLLPKIIVTDMGWALINAVMLSFNNCTVLNYLNWCFDMLFRPYDANLTKVMKIKSYLCSTHLLKNVAKKAKSIQVFSNHVRKTFIFMFTLIQNSVSIDQIDIYLKHIHNIFNNEFLDVSVYESLHFMAQEIRKRHLSSLNIDDTASPQQKERDKYFEDLLKESNIYISVDFEENVKQNSPFSNYYNLMIQKLNKTINEKKEESIKNCYLKNEYFCPKLFGILEEKIHLLPLWTGLIIKDEIKNFKIKTRLTNNPVENWFGQLKNNLLCKKKKRPASILVTILYKRLLSKFYEYYCAPKNKDQNEKKENNPKFFETWSDKKTQKEKEKGNIFLIFRGYKMDLNDEMLGYSVRY